MSKTSGPKKILEHPDREEIVSKLIIGISAKDIHEWLAAKYTNVSEAKFVISEKLIKNFQDNYLDMYNLIKEDLAKTNTALAIGNSDSLQLAVQNNPTYKSKMLELAGQELDIKKMLANMITAVETRCAQVFDLIQADPTSVNTKEERLLIEYFDVLGSNLERWSKYVIGTPDQVVQHNVTVQHIDQHVSILQEAIRETLAEMDIDSSLRFMEIFTKKMEKLKPKTEKEMTTEARLAEVKVINAEIDEKLNVGP